MLWYKMLAEHRENVTIWDAQWNIMTGKLTVTSSTEIQDGEALSWKVKFKGKDEGEKKVNFEWIKRSI